MGDSMADTLSVWSLGDTDSDEADLVQPLLRRSRSSITPEIVSWNGSGFDLPVLHYRALSAWHFGTRAIGRSGDEDRKLPLQQLPEPVSLAAYRCHGRVSRVLIRVHAPGWMRSP